MCLSRKSRYVRSQMPSIVKSPAAIETSLPAKSGLEKILMESITNQMKRGCLPTSSEINRCEGSCKAVCPYHIYSASSPKYGKEVKFKHLMMIYNRMTPTEEISKKMLC